MSAPAAPAEQALGPPLAAAEPAAVVVGSIGYPTQIQKLATACAGGRALVRVRSVHGGSNGSYVYSCSDYACVVVVVLQGYEKATRSTDPVVKAAAVLLRTQIKAGLMQTSACVVTSVNLTHTTTCRSPPHLSLDNLASVPRVQYVFLKARSHEDVIAAVRELTGLELTASDVSRLKTETDDAFEATRATEPPSSSRFWRESRRATRSSAPSSSSRRRHGLDRRRRRKRVSWSRSASSSPPRS